MEHYLAGSLDQESFKKMYEELSEEVHVLYEATKSSPSSEQYLHLMERSQLLAMVNSGKPRAGESVQVLRDIRDEILEYLKAKDDIGVALELALLLNFGFSVLMDHFYQSIKIISDISKRVHRKDPSAKSALLVGASYIFLYKEIQLSIIKILL